MSALNNPASRLLALIARIGSTGANNSKAADVWTEILGIDKSDAALMLRRVGYVMALPDVIRDEIHQVQGVDHALYLKWQPKVEKAFGLLNFQMEWGQFRGFFSAEVIYGVEMCAELLGRQRPEQELNEKLLASILDDVRALLTDIDAGALGAELHAFIREHLMAVRDAVEEYSIRGAKPLQIEVERLHGAVAMQPSRWGDAHAVKDGARFWETMGKVALVVATVHSGAELTQIITKALPPPQNTFQPPAALPVSPALPPKTYST